MYPFYFFAITNFAHVDRKFFFTLRLSRSRQMAMLGQEVMLALDFRSHFKLYEAIKCCTKRQQCLIKSRYNLAELKYRKAIEILIYDRTNAMFNILILTIRSHDDSKLKLNQKHCVRSHFGSFLKRKSSDSRSRGKLIISNFFLVGIFFALFRW